MTPVHMPQVFAAFHPAAMLPPHAVKVESVVICSVVFPVIPLGEPVPAAELEPDVWVSQKEETPVVKEPLPTNPPAEPFGATADAEPVE